MMHRPRIGNGLIDGCSCGFRGNSEATWAHVGGEVGGRAARDPGLDRDLIFDRTVCPEPCGTMHTYDPSGKRLDPCAFDDDMDPLLQQHWLTFDPHGRAVGCHCGYRSDLSQHVGFGDDIVNHFFRVARDDERACRAFERTTRAASKSWSIGSPSPSLRSVSTGLS